MEHDKKDDDTQSLGLNSDPSGMMKMLAPLIRHTHPTLIANELVEEQPMAELPTLTEAPEDNVTNNGDTKAYETKLLLAGATCDMCKHRVEEGAWCSHMDEKPERNICEKYGTHPSNIRGVYHMDYHLHNQTQGQGPVYGTLLPSYTTKENDEEDDE